MVRPDWLVWNTSTRTHYVRINPDLTCPLARSMFVLILTLHVPLAPFLPSNRPVTFAVWRQLINLLETVWNAVFFGGGILSRGKEWGFQAKGGMLCTR